MHSSLNCTAVHALATTLPVASPGIKYLYYKCLTRFGIGSVFFFILFHFISLSYLYSKKSVFFFLFIFLCVKHHDHILYSIHVCSCMKFNNNCNNSIGDTLVVIQVRYYFGLRKEWICNERPITICPIVTCWPHARTTR